jgi:hypothetical protein
MLERARRILLAHESRDRKVTPATAKSAKRRRGRPESPRHVALDAAIVRIVERHRRITCRGVFYQCVNEKLVDKSEDAAKLVQRRLLKLRRIGRIPYSAIVDESRIVYGVHRYRDLNGLAAAASEVYRLDYWRTADCTVQIWVEKRGLAGLLTPVVCATWGLNLFVAAGQFSETYLFNAGAEIARDGRPCFIYVLTDFDPAGKTIFSTLKNGSKSAPGGIARFTDGVPVTVEQLALTAEQVAVWNLPTRPAKRSDKRAAKFIEQHGDVSVELDAIEPEQLIALVEDAIERHMPRAELEELKTVEDMEQDTLRALILSVSDDQS